MPSCISVLDFSSFLSYLNWLEEGFHNAIAYFCKDLRVTSSNAALTLG